MVSCHVGLGARQPRAGCEQFSGDSGCRSKVVGPPMTAKILRLIPPSVTSVPPVPSAWLDSVRFSSFCPSCNDTRSQFGYSPRALLRLLRRDRPIEASCAICSGFWSITVEERARLALMLEPAGS